MFVFRFKKVKLKYKDSGKKPNYQNDIPIISKKLAKKRNKKTKVACYLALLFNVLILVASRKNSF